MSFVWDSNILRHYLEDHPLLLENLTKVPRQHVVLPIVVTDYFSATSFLSLP